MSTRVIRAVWAQARNEQGEPVLGKDGGMPWYVPEDLHHFVQATTPHPVIIGRTTWDSIPKKFRPFTDRHTIVLTRQRDWEPDPASTPERPISVAHTKVEALAIAEPLATQGVIAIGGGEEIFRLFAPDLTELVVTELDITVAGDRYAPPITSAWQQTAASSWHESKTGVAYRFVTYHRAQ